jgi:MFS family permease
MGQESLSSSSFDSSNNLQGIGIFAPFRHRNFTLLFIGQLISFLGDQAYGIALPWTVLTVTGDPRQMSAILVAGTVSRVLLLLLGGALADRMSPRAIMLFADMVRVIVVGVLGFSLFVGLPPLWIVAILAALEGAASGLFSPCYGSITPTILPDSDLAGGNGLMMMMGFAAMVIGPVFGGIATAAQATVAFLVDAASFGISAFSLAAMRIPPRERPSTQRHLMLEIGEGLSYAARTPFLRALMIVTIFGNLSLTGIVGVGLIVLAHNLSSSPVILGILLAAIGIGGIIGGLLAGPVSKLKHRGRIILIGWIINAFLLAIIPFFAGQASGLPGALTFPLGWQVSIIAVMLFLTGLVLSLGDTLIMTLFQQSITPAFLSRVTSVQFLMGGIAQPISLAFAGLIAAMFGCGVIFLIGGLLALGVVIVGFNAPSIRDV